jgi:hypothetical protein
MWKNSLRPLAVAGLTELPSRPARVVEVGHWRSPKARTVLDAQAAEVHRRFAQQSAYRPSGAFRASPGDEMERLWPDVAQDVVAQETAGLAGWSAATPRYSSM